MNVTLNGAEMPTHIYLMDYDDDSEIVWCHDPDPAGVHSDEETVPYIRADQTGNGLDLLLNDSLRELTKAQAERLSGLTAALQRIADMTDIEADFDGFEARQIAQEALAK